MPFASRMTPLWKGYKIRHFSTSAVPENKFPLAGAVFAVAAVAAVYLYQHDQVTDSSLRTSPAPLSTDNEEAIKSLNKDKEQELIRRVTKTFYGKAGRG